MGTGLERRRGPGAACRAPEGRAKRPVHHGHGRRHPADVRRIAPADARRVRRGRARPAGVPLSGRRRPGAHQHARQAVLRERDGTARRAVRRRSGWLARHRGRREPREPRAVPSESPADVRGQEAERARRDGVLGERRHYGGARPDAGGRGDRDARSGLARSAADTRSSISTTTACTTRGSRCTPTTARSFASRSTSCTTGIRPGARRSRPPAARAARTAQEPVPLLRRRHGAHRRDRRVGRALRGAVESRQLRGLVRGATPGRQGALAKRERAGRQPDQLGQHRAGRRDVRGHGRGIRHPGPALGPAARGLRDSWAVDSGA